MSKQRPVLVVVDDRPDNLFIIEQLVDEYIPSCIVYTAENADVAFEMALEHAPDGILSDIQMPGRNGIDLCRQLKENFATSCIPVLLVTAHRSDSNLRAQGLEAGADDFIARPIDNLELAARIKVMFRIKHAHDKLLKAKEELEEKVTQRTADLSKANDELRVKIADELKSAKKIHNLQQQIEFVLGATRTGLVIIDAGYNIRYINSEWAKNCGEIGGKKCYEYFKKRSAECEDEECGLRKALKTRQLNVREQDSLSYEGRCFQVTSIPFQDSTGEWLVAEVNVDITEQKKVYNEKIELKRRVCQVQKMEAIGTLAGGIAHDFNNILSAIIGFSDMALDSLPGDSQVFYDVQKVKKAGRRAAELVKQILAFSRQESQELMPMRMQYVVKDALQLLRASIPTTVEIRENIDKDCGAVLADPTQLHQIVMNLCTNAKHAMREHGGLLEVSLRSVDSESDSVDFDVQTGAARVFVCLEIIDSGCGMSQEVMDRVFDPFYTTKENGEGTGLGLSVVYGIIESYKGFIKCFSEINKGSTFRVYLPVVDGKVNEEKVVETEVLQNTGHILLIDDEPDLLEVHARILERIGYKVTSYTSSIEALNEFKNNPDTFDMILSDMTMPKLTGAELALEAMKIRPNLPVVLCTGFSDIVDKKTALKMGIKGYIEKPIIKQELAEIISGLLDGDATQRCKLCS